MKTKATTTRNTDNTRKTGARTTRTANNTRTAKNTEKKSDKNFGRKPEKKFEKKLEKNAPAVQSVQAAPEENFGIPNLEIEELSFDASLDPIHYTIEEEKSPKSNIILGSMQPVAGFKPEILAPAGDKASFLAGLAAGADSTYVGLKSFSARAGADNFSISELSQMVSLAKEYGKKINVAFNSLVKPNDIRAAGILFKHLAKDVKPNALIIQDAGLIDIARQAGFEGEMHLSTLANITHPKALENAYNLGANRVILPREINIDELRLIAENCPKDLSLELFIHGALCFCVSGRCYWSSYMGGKSGLRGRCVQPCRRVYRQKSREGRYFSSQDLSLDVLVKTLLSIPQINCWKIEGRKKGPHYVYHTVLAYKLLRDEGNAAKKEAEKLLAMALGRPATHSLFLPQNEQTVTNPEENTGSGLLVGKIQFDVVEEKKNQKDKKMLQKGKNHPQSRQNLSLPYFKPYIPLIAKDLLRIGYEDDPWHATINLSRGIPKAGTFTIKGEKHKTPKAGTPVFLIDRKEPDLLSELSTWEKKLAAMPAVQSTKVEITPHLPKPCQARKGLNINVRVSLPQGKETKAARSSLTGLWLSPSTVRAVSRTLAPRISWWLPPVIWTNEEYIWQKTIIEAIRNGAMHFVCNEPWQIAFFQNYPAFACRFENFGQENTSEKGKPNSPSSKIKVARGGKTNQPDNRFHLTAGPFCNIANAAMIALLKRMGYDDAIVSPELSRDDFLLLSRQSSLPLGMVLEGFWPMGLSRHAPLYLKSNIPFESPKGEQFWTRRYGQNLWIYPAWPVDLSAHKAELEHAGYSFFVKLEENCPSEQERKSSEFNWNNVLL